MHSEKEKILIVDDAKLNRTILTKILENKYAVYTANDGNSAIATAKDINPDLLLLDIVLPDIDGFEVIKVFKNTDDLRNIPIVCITGLDYEQDELKGLKLGAIDYIKKPFVEEIVKARVDNQILLCKQRKLVEEIAQYDALTHVPNRRNFEEKLTREFKFAYENKKKFNIGYIDIDFFKQFNDNYGHAKGDEALRMVASSASKVASKYEGYFARIGGEEFCFILLDSKNFEPENVADEIRKQVYELNIEHRFSKIDDILSISVGGVSAKIVNDSSVGKILKTVDNNLYKAKDQGRNRVVWEQI